MAKVKNEFFALMLASPELRDALEILRKDRNLPIKKRYELMNHFDALEKVQLIHIKLRDDILNQYGDKDNEGKLITNKISPESFSVSLTDPRNLEQASQKLTELNVLESDVDRFPIQLELLDLIKGDDGKGLTGEQIKLLERIFEYTDI